MKSIIVLCFILTGLSNLNAQSTPTTTDTNKIFTIVQQPAKFPGDINKWLSENMTYPEAASKMAIEGTVYITFVVDTDGSVTNIKVLRGVDDVLDKEAIRVITKMPKWTPGMANGNKVKQFFTVPLQFKIRNSGKSSLTSAPKFPFELNTWLSGQIRYPAKALKKKIEGDVYVMFIVHDDGSVSDVRIAKGIDNGTSLENEAIRIVSGMPNWTPAYQDGKPVAVQLTLTLKFRLPSGPSKDGEPVKH